MPTFSLPTSPPSLPGRLQPDGNAPLPRKPELASIASVPFPEPPHHASDSQDADLPASHPTRLYRNNQSPACLPSCVTPSLKQSLPVLEYLPVVHLLRSMPRIRSRLTLGRRSLPRNPYAFGGMDSHHSFRYSYQHSHFCEVHRSLQNDFSPHRTLPYPTTYVVATASVSYFSPGNLRRRVSRPVSYYALFKWWLLLSQHPGCFRDPTSFST